ncbi:MAG: hypothetical protein V4549_07720 [Bacteroidota bacterium]
MKTKTVFPTNEIAHLWANKTQSEARNSAYNLFFDNESIYSYGRHFLIAKHVTNSAGKTAVLFTKNSYSNTTAKHIGLVRSASSHLDKIYVPDPANDKYKNFASWISEIESIASNLVKAKKPEIYLNQISVINSEVKAYTKFFDMDMPENLLTALNIANKEQYTEYKNSALERAEKEKKEQENEALKKYKLELKKFRAFAIGAIYNAFIGIDYLRYNEKSKRIETTQGVQIPVGIAHKFYKHIKSVNKKGGCTDCKGKLMNYDVKQINSKFIEIGCHKIEIKEIEKIATLLKW